MEQRLVGGLLHPELWRKDYPMPKRFVGFGQPGCGNFEKLKNLLYTNNITYNVLALDEEGYKGPALRRASVNIITNAQYLPVSFEKLQKRVTDAVIVAMCDIPYDYRQAGEAWRRFWDVEFTYHVVRETPDKNDLINLFEAEMINFTKNYPDIQVDIRRSDCEKLAECADACLESDVKEFCRDVFYDIIYNDVKKVTLEYILTEYLPAPSDISKKRPSISHVAVIPRQACFELAPHKKIRLR